MHEEITVSCPYCAESMVVEPEPANQAFEYIEDCGVCCRPIVIWVSYAEEGSKVAVRTEND
jgi:hypothetical protein